MYAVDNPRRMLDIKVEIRLTLRTPLSQRQVVKKTETWICIEQKGILIEKDVLGQAIATDTVATLAKTTMKDDFEKNQTIEANAVYVKEEQLEAEEMEGENDGNVENEDKEIEEALMAMNKLSLFIFQVQ